MLSGSFHLKPLVKLLAEALGAAQKRERFGGPKWSNCGFGVPHEHLVAIVSRILSFLTFGTRPLRWLLIRYVFSPLVPQISVDMQTSASGLFEDM